MRVLHPRQWSLSIRAALGAPRLALAACSLLRPPPIESLHVEKEPAAEGMQLLQRNPYLYKVPDAAGSPAFFTAIEDCRGRSESPLQSLTRQLLVGLRRPHIVSQQEVRIGSLDALRSFVRAEYEQRQLSVVSYTINDAGCLRDYVFWLQDDGSAAESRMARFDELVRHFLAEKRTPR